MSNTKEIKREKPSWEIVCDIPFDRVRRFRIDGGWLYQVEMYTDSEERHLNSDGTVRIYTSGWQPPVFVPDSGK